MRISLGLSFVLLAGPAGAATVHKCEAADGAVSWVESACPPGQKEIKAIAVAPTPPPAVAPLPPEPPAPEPEVVVVEPAAAPVKEKTKAEELKTEMVYVPQYDMYLPVTKKEATEKARSRREICRQLDREAQTARSRGGDDTEGAYARNQKRQEAGC